VIHVGINRTDSGIVGGVAFDQAAEVASFNHTCAWRRRADDPRVLNAQHRPCSARCGRVPVSFEPARWVRQYTPFGRGGPLVVEPRCDWERSPRTKVSL
jgi:hypothetical protein